jgi:hypothetical protein
MIGCIRKEGPTATISDLDIHKGTAGLEMSFIKNSPPEEVYEVEEFPVYIRIENKGASDVSSGIITLNFQRDYLESTVSSKNIRLDGKSIANPIGEQEIISFSLSAKEIIGESRVVPITASSCYSYTTEAIIPVCIDTDMYNIDTIDKPCEVEDIDTKGGQGGPIVVTKIEPKMLTSETEARVTPQFAIEVENVKDGRVIRSSKARDLCSARALQKQDIDVIEVSVELSDRRLSCNKDFLKLENGVDKVVCSLESGIDPDEPAYTTLLKIILDYGYSQTVTQNIILKERYT